LTREPERIVIMIILVRKTTTGSFLVAIFDGINPETKVNPMLRATRTMSPITGRAAMPETPETIL